MTEHLDTSERLLWIYAKDIRDKGGDTSVIIAVICRIQLAKNQHLRLLNRHNKKCRHNRALKQKLSKPVMKSKKKRKKK